MQACLGPLAFFDVERGRQERGGRSQSLMNHEEVKLIFTLLNFVFHHHEPDAVGTVAVIAAYKSQASLYPFRVCVNLCIVSVMACKVRPRRQCGIHPQIPHGQEVAACMCARLVLPAGQGLLVYCRLRLVCCVPGILLEGPCS